MLVESNLQKWGNSQALRLPAKILAASGIDQNSPVDIKSGDGQIIIQLREKTQEDQFDELFADLPEAEELLKLVQERLTATIELTNETTEAVQAMRESLSGNQDKLASNK
jgi:antitoxin component of MazEF toxin-antitoxin module